MKPGYYDFRHVFLDKEGELRVFMSTYYLQDELDAREVKQTLRQGVVDTIAEEISLNYTPEYLGE